MLVLLSVLGVSVLGGLLNLSTMSSTYHIGAFPNNPSLVHSSWAKLNSLLVNFIFDCGSGWGLGVAFGSGLDGGNDFEGVVFFHLF